LWLTSIGTTVPTANVAATALRFFFKVTLKRHDLAEELVSTREPRRLPVVLSPDEVGRLLASARNIKHKALLSLAYATGLRASEVVSLKLTDIDSGRMVIRVEQARLHHDLLHARSRPFQQRRLIGERTPKAVDEIGFGGGADVVEHRFDTRVIRFCQVSTAGPFQGLQCVLRAHRALAAISLNYIKTSGTDCPMTFGTAPVGTETTRPIW
jgi:hypothetical protein